MALSRLKTWISEVLTAADLNAEFNNILNNPMSLISPLTGALDVDGKEIILDADADTSITADTDDQIDFKVGGSDIYRMTSTSLSALGSATIVSGMTLIGTTTASAAATADIEGFSSTYDSYTIIVENLSPATSGAILHCRLKIGGSYATSTYQYHANISRSNAATYSGLAATSAAQIVMTPAMSNAATADASIRINLSNVNGTAKAKGIDWTGNASIVGDNYIISGAGNNSGTGALSGVRLYCDTGNISLTARLYGHVK